MNTKIAELIVIKSADYNNEVVKALENAGFVLIMDTEMLFETKYIIAKVESEDKE